MRQTVNIDNLARLARERNDEAAWRSLWNAVVRLPAWFGVGTADRPDVPVIMRGAGAGGEAGKPILFAFTDEARARWFVNHAPPAPGRSRIASVVRMPLPGVIRYAAGLAGHGVEHIVFNAARGVEGFGFPTAALAQLAAALGRQVPAAAPAPTDPGAPPAAPPAP